MSSSISRARAPAVGPRAGLPVFPHSGALRGWGRHPGRQGPSCAKDRYSTHRQARCRGRGRPPRSTAPGTRVLSPAGAALRDAAAEAGRTPAPGQSLTSPSRGRRALGGWQRKEDRGPARRRNAPPTPGSEKPPQMAEPIPRRSRLLLCVTAEQELRRSSNFYGTSKGNNQVENELPISQLFNE